MTRFWQATSELGHVVMLATQDEQVLIDWAEWLDAHRIGWKMVTEAETGWDALSTDIITDTSLALLAKLTWGGSI